MDSMWSEKIDKWRDDSVLRHEEEDAPHTESVALLLSRSVQKALKGTCT